MADSAALASIPEPRRSLLVALKLGGAQRIGELAEAIGITYEGTRQHLQQLELQGWAVKRVERDSTPGRPGSRYRLTDAGDHLFPKEYEDLAVALIDAAGDRLGPAAVRTLLEEVARRKVEKWRPALEGKPLPQRLEALRNIYLEDDPFCRVEHGDGGPAKLVELNCPYLDVARRRPALCSVTVSVLRELLGRKVVRTERFQDGCGRCVFTIADDRVPAETPLFDWEPEPEPEPDPEA
ncbi:MAG TPA: winged helix-turn-helix transcriptional regulator [Thermoanaerobaculia bacterium]